MSQNHADPSRCKDCSTLAINNGRWVASAVEHKGTFFSHACASHAVSYDRCMNSLDIWQRWQPRLVRVQVLHRFCRFWGSKLRRSSNLRENTWTKVGTVARKGPPTKSKMKGKDVDLIPKVRGPQHPMYSLVHATVNPLANARSTRQTHKIQYCEGAMSANPPAPAKSNRLRAQRHTFARRHVEAPFGGLGFRLSGSLRLGMVPSCSKLTSGQNERCYAGWLLALKNLPSGGSQKYATLEWLLGCSQRARRWSGSYLLEPFGGPQKLCKVGTTLSV